MSSHRRKVAFVLALSFLLFLYTVVMLSKSNDVQSMQVNPEVIAGYAHDLGFSCRYYFITEDMLPKAYSNLTTPFNYVGGAPHHVLKRFNRLDFEYVFRENGVFFVYGGKNGELETDLSVGDSFSPKGDDLVYTICTIEELERIYH